MSELQLVQVRKAAELTAAAEAVRARVLTGDATADPSSPLPHVAETVSLTITEDESKF